MKVFGFAGPAGSGKDTCGAYLIEKYGFQKVSFAGTLKAMLTAAGLPEPKTAAQKEEIIPWLGVSWRHCAQTLGTEWGRRLINDNIWVRVALRNLNPDGSYVFTDVRFENEAKAIRDAGGWIVHLEGRKAPMAVDTQAHASEVGIYKESCDYRVDNSVPLEQLQSTLTGLYEFLTQSTKFKRWKCTNPTHCAEYADNTGLCPVCNSRLIMVAR